MIQRLAQRARAVCSSVGGAVVWSIHSSPEEDDQTLDTTIRLGLGLGLVSVCVRVRVCLCMALISDYKPHDSKT